MTLVLPVDLPTGAQGAHGVEKHHNGGMAPDRTNAAPPPARPRLAARAVAGAPVPVAVPAPGTPSFFNKMFGECLPGLGMKSSVPCSRFADHV